MFLLYISSLFEVYVALKSYNFFYLPCGDLLDKKFDKDGETSLIRCRT